MPMRRLPWLSTQSHVRRTGVLQTHNQPRVSIGIAERNAGVAIVGHFEFSANLAALIRQNQSRCFRLAVHGKGAAQVAALVSQNETLRFDGACHVGLALTQKEGGQNQDREADTGEAITKILLLEFCQPLEYFCGL